MSDTRSRGRSSPTTDRARDTASSQLSPISMDHDWSSMITTSSAAGPPTAASRPPRTKGRANAAISRPSAASRMISSSQ